MKKIYIAGKVSGLPKREVIKKFKEAEDQVAAAGFEAVNPLTVVGTWETTWSDAMKKCIIALMDCDAVYLLPCHFESPGALLEKKIASGLNIGYSNDLASLQQYFKNPF